METSLTDQLFKEPSLTDQLVESKEPEQRRVIDFPKTPYDDLMKSASEEHGVPYDVLYSNLRQESRFDPKATSYRLNSKGEKVPNAKGLAQFIDSTAKTMGITDAYDPKQAIPGSAKYLRQLYDQFGDWKLAVAAYNAGPGAVRKAGNKVPDIAETQNHVKQVFREGVGTDLPVKKKSLVAETSLTDELFKVEEPVAVPEPIAPPIVTPQVTDPKDYYSRTSFSPYGVIHPAVSAKMGREGFGPKPEGGFDELGRPLGSDGIPYNNEGIDKDKLSQPVADTLKGLSSLATHPMEVIKGGLDFVMSAPGFGVGLLGAAGRGGKTLVDQLAYGKLDLDKVYTSMSEGMEESMKFFEPGKALVVGEPSKESQLVGQIVMAPMNVTSKVFQDTAGYEGFSDSPNIKGALKISGDVVALMSMGYLLHGGSRRAEFAKEVEGISNEAKVLADKEILVNQSLDTVVKNVQLKELQVQKQMLEAKAAGFAKKFGDDIVVIEEAGRQAEQIAQEKMRPVEESVQMVKLDRKLQREEAKAAVEPKVEELKKDSTTGLPEAFKGLASGISDSFYNQAFDSLKNGKTKVAGIEEPIVIRAKSAFDKGEIKSANDLRNWANNNYFNKGKAEVGETVVDPVTGKKTFKVKEEVERRSREYVPATVEETLSNFPTGKETDSLVNRYRMDDNLHVDGEGNYKLDSHLEASEIARDKGGTVIPVSDGKFVVALEPQKRVMFEKSALEKGAEKQVGGTNVTILKKPAKPDIPFKPGDMVRIKEGAEARAVHHEESFDLMRSFGIGETKITDAQMKDVNRKTQDYIEKNYGKDALALYNSERNIEIEWHKANKHNPNGVSELMALDRVISKYGIPKEIPDRKKADVVVLKKKKVEDKSVKKFNELEAEEELSPKAKAALDRLIEEDEAAAASGEVAKVEEPVKPSSKINYLDEKKVSDVDRQTGTEVPDITDTDSAVFAADKKKTFDLAQIYEERRAAVESDPEVYVQKLINDVNRYRHGADVDIKAVREKLSEMAARSSELRDFFMTGADHLQFTEITSEAAKWARTVGKAGSGKGVRLNTMIPLDEIPGAVKDLLKIITGGANSIKASAVYRHKALWQETRFWLGKDIKWRYELDDSKSIFSPPNVIREEYEATGEAIAPIQDVLRYPDLFNVVPELAQYDVKFNKNFEMDGQFNPNTKTITIRRMGDKKTLMHEVTHAVNDFLGSEFTGTSEARQHALVVADRLERIAKGMTSDRERKYILKAVKDVRESWYTFPSDLTTKLKSAGLKIDKDTEALINFPTGAFEKYARDAGEMEARVVERRLNMTHAERISEAPWETLDKMLMDENRPRGVGSKLYSGLPLDEALKMLKNKLKNPRYKIGDVIESVYKTPEGRFNGTIKRVIVNKNSPDTSTRFRYEIEWDNGRTETVGQNRIQIKGIEGGSKEGSTLYSGDPAMEAAARAIIAGAKKVGEYTAKARGMKNIKLGEAAKMLKQEFNRAFVDRSGNIRKELLDKLGDDGYEVLQKLVLSKGASARSAAMLKQMRSEVYDGLSKREKKILDDIILDDRMIDIAKYKGPTEYNYPGGMKPADFIAHRELFPQLEGLSLDRAQLLDARAKAYFEWMRKPLKDMLESGLIDQAEYDLLASHNYRKTKLVEIFDKKRPSVGTKGKSVYDSGIEALSRGRETDIYEPSSEIMALEVFNRSYGRILNNEANKTLIDLAKKDPENGFARVKDKDNPIPTGWHRVFAYEGGERKSVYISPEMSKEWINSSPEMSYRLSQFVRWSSGSVVTRTFATGIEWGFALANLPRDMMHLWFAARTFENGKWNPVYNPNLPVYGLQIGRDIATVFADAALKKGRYNDYINEGGGMEFLVHQGRLFQRGRHLESGMDKVYNVLGYLGETSEVLTRLAIRERVIRNRANEQGISMEQARKTKKITDEATFAARDYMDFGQGGGISKAVDNGMPYLNATIQGTRGLMRALQPGSGSALSSTYKLAQLAALTTGVYIAAKSSSPNTMQALQGDVAMQNNLCIPLGDQFSFLDEQGQTRYMYLKVPLDPGQKFFKTFFEASADKWLGNEVDVDRVTGSLSQLSPVGMSSLPPTISSTLGYATNKSFWLNEDIWKGSSKPFSYPNSKEEYTSRTPQAYKDFGQVTGASPERTKYAVEQLVTQGSMWSYLLNQGYDKTFGDLTKERKEQHIGMTLSQVPIAKRFFGVTKPYAKYASKFDEAEEMSTIKKFTENRGMDTLVDSYLYGTNTSRKEVTDYARSFKDIDTYDRLMERFKWEESIKTLPEKAFWKRMKGLDTEAKAKMFVDRLESSDVEAKKQLWREFAVVGANKGVVTDDFLIEVSKLRGRKKVN